MAIISDNRVIHRFIQDISEYEVGGKFYSQIIPLDTQAYAIYPDKEGNKLFYVIGDGEHTYTEIRDGLGNGESHKEYPVFTKENLNDIHGGSIEQEARERKAADELLQTHIDEEKSARERFDSLLDEALGSEIQNRELAVSNLSNELSGHTSNTDIHVTSEEKQQWSGKQDVLINQENIKSINGVSLLGSGNIEIVTHLEYPSSWPTTSSTSTKQFCDVVAADVTAVEGKSYLGEVRWNDLPGLVNGEVEVEIMAGTTTNSKVIVLTLTSGNKAPYMWKYTYWNGGQNVSGWKGFVPTTNVANKIYGTDSHGDQTTYSAGDNIEFNNNKISTPSTVLNKIKNVTVDPIAFVSDIRYSGYKYRADVSVNGVTANHYPNVIFSIEDCLSNNYASFVESGNGYVSIWCKELPESTITIPVITFE